MTDTLLKQDQVKLVQTKIKLRLFYTFFSGKKNEKPDEKKVGVCKGICFGSLFNFPVG